MGTEAIASKFNDILALTGFVPTRIRRPFDGKTKHTFVLHVSPINIELSEESQKVMRAQ
jgi:hypothetical protein